MSWGKVILRAQLNTRLYCPAEKKGIVKKVYSKFFFTPSWLQFFPLEWEIFSNGTLVERFLMEKNVVSDIITGCHTRCPGIYHFRIFESGGEVEFDGTKGCDGRARGKYLRQAPCCFEFACWQYRRKVHISGKKLILQFHLCHWKVCFFKSS